MIEIISILSNIVKRTCAHVSLQAKITYPYSYTYVLFVKFLIDNISGDVVMFMFLKMTLM